jgi:hypothetical protein
MARKNAEKAQEVRERIKKWDDHWKDNRDQYYLFTTFIMGNQWTEDESRVFENYRKMPLTVNKIAPLVSHVVGEQRQNTPNIQVEPEEGVDEQTAEVREALVKDISFESHAKVVYQTAFQQSVVGGFSGYYIGTKYDNERTFNQVPTINAVKDPCRCYWDIGAQSPCKTDGMFGGFRTRVTRKRFRAIYGKSLEKKIPTANDEENSFIPVADDDSITIIDDYERDYNRGTLYKLSDESEIDEDEYKQLEEIEIDGNKLLLHNGEPVTVVDTRETHNYTVKYTKWAGDYELETNEFPSEQLNVIFVDQNSYWDKKGKQVCRPMFKDARDAQRYLNYIATQSAYLLKVSRYDQFMASKQNVRSPDTTTIWRNPSTIQGALLYDESPNGNKPEQLRPPELSQSLSIQYERALMDIQTCTGMYNTQIGEQGNEVSGKAIDARTKRGSYNTYVPFDSLNRAIAVGAEIINEMIPTLYDTKRALKLNLKNKGLTDVTLNEPLDEYSDERKNDMTKGYYKIRLVPGPSYENQKQENLESIQNVLATNPQLFNLVADLYVENLPMANSLEMRNRLKTIVPPEIIEAGKTGKVPPPKPQPPDPMLLLKQGELQNKMHDTQMKAITKMQELHQKEQQMIMDAHIQGVATAKDLEKIKMEKQQAEAELQDSKLRYTAEMERIHLDAHKNHSQNVVKILTHQPKFTEGNDNAGTSNSTSTT